MDLRAPRDPQRQRPCIYIMLDQMVQGVKRQNGRCTGEIYLDGGRLLSKARVVGGVEDPKILEMLGSCQGFYRLVHSVGVAVSGSEDQEVKFGWKNYGAAERYAGTCREIRCRTNGAEEILYFGTDELADAVVGQCYIDFGNRNSPVRVTVRLYLHDGYEAPKLAVDPPVDWDGEPLRELVKRSLVQTGNLTRIRRVIEKARSGEEVVMALIGGSITQGAGAVPLSTECYAYQTYRDFRDRYCAEPEKCRLIKAGIGGTSSELGLIRYERDVEQFGAVKPDLVVVEFAVNDNGDETLGICHESLIYRILQDPKEPAVIMLFSVFADDWNLQDRLIPIGKRYELPMVSMADALVGQFGRTRAEGSVVTKRQYFYDAYHPTNIGHRMMALCLGNVFQAAELSSGSSGDIDLRCDPALGRNYARIQFYDRMSASALVSAGGFTEWDRELQSVERDQDEFQTPQFTNNWMHGADGGTSPWTLRITCQTLFLVVKDSDASEFGRVTVVVDDIPVLTYDAREIGWVHCNAVRVLDCDKKEEHVVKLFMAEGNEEKKFTILGFAAAEEI